MSEVRSVDLQELGVTIETFEKIYSMGEEDGREDAIDEFAKELHRIMKEDGVCYERTIDKIAEQLKEQNK